MITRVLFLDCQKKDIEDVRTFGKIRYAFLGVRYVIINQQIREEKNLPVSYGALLIKGPEGEPAILSGSPAEKAGLQEGDIILEFGGIRVDTNHLLADLILKRRVGEEVNLKILRDEKEMIIRVTLEERPEKI